jgi:hypothetical protein
MQTPGICLRERDGERKRWKKEFNLTGSSLASAGRVLKRDINQT